MAKLTPAQAAKHVQDGEVVRVVVGRDPGDPILVRFLSDVVSLTVEPDGRAVHGLEDYQH